MKKALENWIRQFDRLTTALQLSLGRERAGLVTLLFHHVFKDNREIEENIVLPQERVTVFQYRQIIEYFLSAGYRFVAPDDLNPDTFEDQKLIMITFDDGYYNNLRILPLLREFQIPAAIFIATDFVIHQQAYWWDVVHRNRTQQGATEEKISSEMQLLMMEKRGEIEAYLCREFGRNALTPVGDIDRPLTPSELKTLASNDLVYIGNHTASHLHLASLDTKSITVQLEDSQTDLARLIGRTPDTLSYPYGSYSKQVMSVGAHIGFRLAITCLPIKSELPISPRSSVAMQIGRCKVFGDGDIVHQCAQARSDVSVHKTLQRRKLIRG